MNVLTVAGAMVMLVTKMLVGVRAGTVAQMLVLVVAGAMMMMAHMLLPHHA